MGEVFRRMPDGMNMRLVIALMASVIVFDGQSGAWAFDFFGLWGSDETPSPVSRAAISYRVTIDVAGGDKALKNAVMDASSLYKLRKDAPLDGEALARRATSDFGPVIDALWGAGYYNATVTIAIDVTVTVDPGPVAPFGEATIVGPKHFDPAIVRSFLYIQPGDPYSPRALADARTSIREIPAVGGVRITEGPALDAYGQLPYQIDVEDRLPYAVGASAKYSTTNGPAGQVYWEDRNLFGGAERLRLQADLLYAPPNSGFWPDFQRFSTGGLGGRISASFLKPGFWGPRNDLLIDALGERVSTSAVGFVGYEATDADVTAALRHRFSQAFSVQAGVGAPTRVAP